MPAPGLREREVHKLFRAEGKKRGVAVYKIGGQMQNGVWDLLLLGDGWSAHVELKRDIGELSKLQEDFGKELERACLRRFVFHGAFTREETKAKIVRWFEQYYRPQSDFDG